MFLVMVVVVVAIVVVGVVWPQHKPCDAIGGHLSGRQQIAHLKDTPARVLPVRSCHSVA
jgi:preprotein translocase subunit SecG